MNGRVRLRFYNISYFSCLLSLSIYIFFNSLEYRGDLIVIIKKKRLSNLIGCSGYDLKKTIDLYKILS